MRDSVSLKTSALNTVHTRNRGNATTARNNDPRPLFNPAVVSSNDDVPSTQIFHHSGPQSCTSSKHREFCQPMFMAGGIQVDSLIFTRPETITVLVTLPIPCNYDPSVRCGGEWHLQGSGRRQVELQIRLILNEAPAQALVNRSLHGRRSACKRKAS